MNGREPVPLQHSPCILPGTQSGRASVELPETQWCGQSWVAQREGTEKVRPGTSSFAATATLDHPHVLSYARHSVCVGLNRNLCIPTYERFNIYSTQYR